MMNSILMVTAGGTIDKVYFDAKSDFQVGQSVVGEMLHQAQVAKTFEVVEVFRKDSLEITDQDREKIRRTVVDHPSTQVIVTHGTDTMVETAQVLEGIDGKTIVLTGALSPARFAQTDATFNVGLAFGAVQCLPAGVYIAMNGQIFHSGKVRKDVAANKFVKT